ncbi:MAG: hypothetical protein Q8P07_00425 [bacterium]|nr:hypothetical protein [bacterium]
MAKVIRDEQGSWVEHDGTRQWFPSVSEAYAVKLKIDALQSAGAIIKEGSTGSLEIDGQYIGDLRKL